MMRWNTTLIVVSLLCFLFLMPHPNFFCNQGCKYQTNHMNCTSCVYVCMHTCIFCDDTDHTRTSCWWTRLHPGRLRSSAWEPPVRIHSSAGQCDGSHDGWWTSGTDSILLERQKTFMPWLNSIYSLSLARLEKGPPTSGGRQRPLMAINLLL